MKDQTCHSIQGDDIVFTPQFLDQFSRISEPVARAVSFKKTAKRNLNVKREQDTVTHISSISGRQAYNCTKLTGL